MENNFEQGSMIEMINTGEVAVIAKVLPSGYVIQDINGINIFCRKIDIRIANLDVDTFKIKYNSFEKGDIVESIKDKKTKPLVIVRKCQDFKDCYIVKPENGIETRIYSLFLNKV